MKRPWAVLAIALTLYSGCRPSPEPPQTMNTPLAAVGRVSSREFRDEYRGFGTVAQRSSTDVVSEVSGRVVEIFVEEGQVVFAGTPLSQIDDFSLQVSRIQTEAQFDSARTELQLAEQRVIEGRRNVEGALIAIAKQEAELVRLGRRVETLENDLTDTERLAEVGGTPADKVESAREQLESARSQFTQGEFDLELQRIGYRDSDLSAVGLSPGTTEDERREALIELNTASLAAAREVAAAKVRGAQAELERIDSLLRRARVTSPVAGTVAVRHLEIGEQADERSPIVTIFDTSQVYIMIEVPERAIGRVAVGQRTNVRLRLGGLERSGPITLITPFVSAQTRTTMVRALLDNDDGAFIPGMFVEVVIDHGSSRELPALPRGAVLQEPTQSSVQVVRGERVFRQVVRLGDPADGVFPVVEGVREGDIVLRDFDPALPDGAGVRLQAGALYD